MGKFSERYKTDRKSEEEGIWVDFGDGIKVQLRRMNSDHSKKTRARLEKPYATTYRGREMPQSLQEDLLNKQMAQSIVMNWEGIEDPKSDGKMLAYTEENVLRICEEFKDFREDLLTASMERATFQLEALKDAEGNS